MFKANDGFRLHEDCHKGSYKSCKNVDFTQTHSILIRTISCAAGMHQPEKGMGLAGVLRRIEWSTNRIAFTGRRKAACFYAFVFSLPVNRSMYSFIVI